MRRSFAFALTLALIFLQAFAQDVPRSADATAPQNVMPTQTPTPTPTPPPPPPRVRADAYRDAAARIIGAALTDDTAYRRLSYLTDRIGHRLSGSDSLRQAIEWALAEMKKESSLTSAPRRSVPHWVRGEESLESLSRRPSSTMLGVGNSVGTPPLASPRGRGGAKLRESKPWAARAAKSSSTKCRSRVTARTVQYRGSGASRAERYGAVAALSASVTP